MTKTGKNAPPARVPQGTRKPRKPPAGRADVSICERHLSPALRGLPAESLKIAPLTGTRR
ncbi:MAG: hypothetical protein LBV50_11300 [Novosphingobium sp.]|jgi:hypothetical protein|nr:hypothetical protein [Novosphingobium sp.]